MPYSIDLFNAEVEAFLRAKPADTYLDLGPGAGKYGRMIRRVNENATIAAVECNPEYVAHFELESIYDVVRCGQVETMFDELPDFTVDVVIIGDMIEHLKKSDGVDLINYLVYRCRYCLVIYPHKYVQYSWRGRAAEAHRSVWTEHDFAPFSATHQTKKSMSLAIITGYLADPEAVFGDDFERPEPLLGLI
ncbi:MAG: class I SAM-dependent methyltransferase [Enhygromyxa sp.]